MPRSPRQFCNLGHPLVGENVKKYERSGPICVSCSRIRARDYWDRRKRGEQASASERRTATRERKLHELIDGVRRVPGLVRRDPVLTVRTRDLLSGLETLLAYPPAKETVMRLRENYACFGTASDQPLDLTALREALNLTLRALVASSGPAEFAVPVVEPPSRNQTQLTISKPRRALIAIRGVLISTPRSSSHRCGPNCCAIHPRDRLPAN